MELSDLTVFQKEFEPRRVYSGLEIRRVIFRNFKEGNLEGFAYLTACGRIHLEATESDIREIFSDNNLDLSKFPKELHEAFKVIIVENEGGITAFQIVNHDNSLGYRCEGYSLPERSSLSELYIWKFK
ncbi:hypothetical protein HY498_05795 [Candidatus Woesearchaeota archaeon]|nr:hypothetical protein [Candidatus Woesearchaeota archaeon]